MPAGQISVNRSTLKELLPLRVRLRGVGTIDEETEQEMINKADGTTQPIKTSVLRTEATPVCELQKRVTGQRAWDRGESKRRPATLRIGDNVLYPKGR